MEELSAVSETRYIKCFLSLFISFFTLDYIFEICETISNRYNSLLVT
jgi:hypothetical protein